MSQKQPLKLKGAPGSPYTRKMLAYLRFRHIPYELLIGDQSAALYSNIFSLKLDFSIFR